MLVYSLGYIDGKVIVNILGDVDGISLVINVRTKLSSLDGSFDGSNDGNLGCLLLGGSRG